MFIIYRLYICIFTYIESAFYFIHLSVIFFPQYYTSDRRYAYVELKRNTDDTRTLISWSWIFSHFSFVESFHTEYASWGRLKFINFILLKNQSYAQLFFWKVTVNTVEYTIPHKIPYTSVCDSLKSVALWM